MKLESIWNELIKENQELMIGKIVELLNKSYEPKTGMAKSVGEYKEKPILVNKIDGEILEAENVFGYLMRKFPQLSEDFVKQTFLDWYNGKFKNGNYSLSKTTPM